MHSIFLTLNKLSTLNVFQVAKARGKKMSISFQSLALKVTKDEEVASLRICPLITTFGIDDQADKSPSSSLFVFVSFSVCFSFVFVVYFSLYFDILFSLAFSFYLICLSFLVWLSLLIFSISCFVSI